MSVTFCMMIPFRKKNTLSAYRSQGGSDHLIKPARRPAENDDRLYLRFFFHVSEARNAARTTTMAQHSCRSIFTGTLNPSNISSGTINRQLMRKHHSAALLRILPVSVSSPMIPLHNNINDMVLSKNHPARRRASVFFQHAFEISSGLPFPFRTAGGFRGH